MSDGEAQPASAPRDADATPVKTRFPLLALAPVVVFALLAGFMGVQLLSGRDDTLPSALIDRPAPDLDLPILGAPDERLTRATLADGEVSILNVWASWCGPCRVEHPELMALGDLGVAQMLSMNYKDETAAAQRFLDELGDPFDRTGVDASGQAALSWGLTGVPETFVIDGQGRIVYKHTGPIANNDLRNKILPAIERAAAR